MRFYPRFVLALQHIVSLTPRPPITLVLGLVPFCFEAALAATCRDRLTRRTLVPATTRFPEETGRSRSAIADGTSAPFFFFIARFNDPKPGSVGLGADK
jgi:hypothetical protein